MFLEDMTNVITTLRETHRRQQFDSEDTSKLYSLHSRRFSNNIRIKKTMVSLLQTSALLLLLLQPLSGWSTVSTASELQGTPLCRNNPPSSWIPMSRTSRCWPLASSPALLCSQSTATQLLHPWYTLPGWSAQSQKPQEFYVLPIWGKLDLHP